MKLLLIHSSREASFGDAFAHAIDGVFNIERVDERGDVRSPDDLDAVVLLWSSRLRPFAPTLDRIALEAWAEDRLIVIALDDSDRPLGLRDLPAIDASSGGALMAAAESLRRAVMIGVVDGFPTLVRREVERRDEMVVGSRSSATASARAPTAPMASAPAAGGGFAFGALGYGAIALVVVVWLASQTGRDVLGVLLGLAILAGLALLAVRFANSRRTARARVIVAQRPAAPAMKVPVPSTASAPTVPRPQKPSDVFVSYAHADIAVVDQVLAAVSLAGKEIWIDRSAIQSGDSWAGEIVRAIKTTRGLLVMCSAQAFRSDHVKREVYLAGKYSKPIVPIFVEAVEPPDDFEYFLAGVQRLDWHSAGPEARRAAVTAAVAKF